MNAAREELLGLRMQAFEREQRVRRGYVAPGLEAQLVIGHRPKNSSSAKGFVRLESLNFGNPCGRQGASNESDRSRTVLFGSGVAGPI
jgi:hypothetical protein